MLLLLQLTTAIAAPPADLDGLVVLAFERDPEIGALSFDAEAAQARAQAARRPMDPLLMVGVEAIGAMPDAIDPTMGMVGVTQMFRGWGEGRAATRRNELDGVRAGVDRERVAADLRTRLWQAAARIGALQEQLKLLDEQVQSAEVAGEVALARYSAAAVVTGGMGSIEGGGMQMSAEPMQMGARPPTVEANRGGSGMGMAGMGGGTGARGAGVATPDPSMPTPSAAPRKMGGDTGGLPVLLALQAEIARVEADRAAIGAELGGEIAVLAAFVGTEGAEAVRASPAGYFGAAPAAVPERDLAEVDRQIAVAGLDLARAARRPDVMLSVAERVMPTGMPAGTDAALGIEIPMWGSGAHLIDAARADVDAAVARAARVDRDLVIAAATARAALEAARLRSEVLDSAAVPKARAAWEASLALFASGTAGQDTVLRVWQTRIAVEREAVLARRDVQLRAAELARVEGS